MKLKVLDLFAGLGGFSLGLERTGGFETVAFCDINPYCRRVLAKHWPGTPCHDDVKTLTLARGMADVVTAGFPCQDISLAGKGAGLAGERSGLWWQVRRTLRVVRPRVALLENVAALLNRGMGTVLGSLAAIGYNAEWHCIPDGYIGAPHERDRVWIIAHPDEARPQIGLLQPSIKRAAELAQDRENPAMGAWWSSEPGVVRVVHGIPGRVDRVGALGNAVVPQIPELIGKAILQAEGLSP